MFPLLLPWPESYLEGAELSAFWLYILLENTGCAAGFLDDLILKL